LDKIGDPFSLYADQCPELAFPKEFRSGFGYGFCGPEFHNFIKKNILNGYRYFYNLQQSSAVKRLVFFMSRKSKKVEKKHL
jgi:hypothetical protein